MQNDLNVELKNLVEAFSNLDFKTQKEEVVNKLKTLFDVMRNVNSSQEMVFPLTNKLSDENDLSMVFMLCCVLEEEIAKTLEKVMG